MNLDALMAFQIAPIEQAYTTKDAILYALGLGYGADPLDEDQIAYVYEDGLKIAPSMCNTIAHPKFWLNRPELGIDWVKVLHAEQAFEIYHPLPPGGVMRASYEILGVEDKGAEKGATLSMRKTLTDVATGEPSCAVTQTVFLRGDGGQGGFGRTPTPLSTPPEGEPDLTIDIPTIAQIALIYRLSGDINPIHASPAIARKAGFDRPILHGLCTMGIATRALVGSVCKGAPERLRSMSVRFSRPVYPGETIRTEVYGQEGVVRFRCRVVERDIIVLDRGQADIAAA